MHLFIFQDSSDEFVNVDRQLERGDSSACNFKTIETLDRQTDNLYDSSEREFGA